MAVTANVATKSRVFYSVDGDGDGGGLCCHVETEHGGLWSSTVVVMISAVSVAGAGPVTTALVSRRGAGGHRYWWCEEVN